MSNLHLVTGYAGKAHVSAADHGSFVEAVIRSGQFVTNAGSKFAAAVISNNQIRISDGELIMQGRHVKLDPGAYIDVTVENGAQGYCRNDLIVARYQKNVDSSIETVDFVTIKGTPVESNPSDPAYITGDINGGNALQNDMPMYRVPLDGLNVGELVPLFTPQDALFDMILHRDGSVPMGGDLDMGGHRVKDVAEPEADGDAVNLGYVNENFAPAGLHRSLGTLPNNTYKWVSIGIQATNVAAFSGIIHADGEARVLPFNNGTEFVDIYFSGTSICIQTNFDASAYFGEIQIWYVE